MNRCTRTASTLLLACAPLPAAASLAIAQQTYLCERGVAVPAIYVTETSTDPDAGAVVILNLDGRQITLWQEVAASGVRYGYPSDGSHYVWWTKGHAATLYWHDGTDGSEAVVLQDCTATG